MIASSHSETPTQPTTASTAPPGNAPNSGRAERQIFGIGTHGETLIAVGERGTILTSNNGLEWSLASLELPGSAVEVEWLDGRWLATGWNGLLTVSL